MGITAQLLDFFSGRAFRPEPTDPAVPLVTRLAGQRLLVVELQPDAAQVAVVRISRSGRAHAAPAQPHAPPPGGIPDAAWAAQLRRLHGIRHVALFLPATDLALRRAVNFAAPSSLFGTVLATRPEVIAGPLRPGRTVTGFRDPERPVAILAEGPAAAIERTIEACSAAGLRPVRLQCLALAALEAALRSLPPDPPAAVAVVISDQALVLPFAPDGTWEPPLLLPVAALADPGILPGPDPVAVAQIGDAPLPFRLPGNFVPLASPWPLAPAQLALQQ